METCFVFKSLSLFALHIVELELRYFTSYNEANMASNGMCKDFRLVLYCSVVP